MHTLDPNKPNSSAPSDNTKKIAFPTDGWGTALAKSPLWGNGQTYCEFREKAPKQRILLVAYRTDSRPMYRLTYHSSVDWYVVRHFGRVSVDLSTKMSTDIPVDMSTDTRPICWSICQPRMVVRLSADVSIDRLRTFRRYFTAWYFRKINFCSKIFLGDNLPIHRSSVGRFVDRCIGRGVHKIHMIWLFWLMNTFMRSGLTKIKVIFIIKRSASTVSKSARNHITWNPRSALFLYCLHKCYVLEDFIVYMSKGLSMERIMFNQDHWDTLREKVCDYYCYYTL